MPRHYVKKKNSCSGCERLFEKSDTRFDWYGAPKGTVYCKKCYFDYLEAYEEGDDEVPWDQIH